jgi:multicomponent Na+:H+ antiporter subunit E
MKVSLNYGNTGKWGSVIIQFLMLLIFWLVLSGRFQAKYVIIGVVSTAFITWFTNDYFYSVLRQGEFRAIKIWLILEQLWRFLLYLPWLFYQIIVANIQVAYYVLHPRMPVDPGLLLFQTKMKKGMSQVTLANSITLTPGTITASLEDNRYTVHTLKRSLASLLETGTMQLKVSKVFLEEGETPPQTSWVHSIKETAE